MIAFLFAVFQQPSIAGFFLVISKSSLPIPTAFLASCVGPEDRLRY
jgi:hypothetical protein